MGSTHCWHCGKKLQLPYYAEVKDPVGNVHRVHKCCAKDAVESMRQLTAGWDSKKHGTGPFSDEADW